MQKENKKTINSDAYGYLQSLVHPNMKIVDLYVEGKYLKADLYCKGRYDAGVRFAVKNQSVD